LYSESPVTDREGRNRFIYLDLGKSTGHSFGKRKKKKKMSKGSSTTANKQITDDPLNFFCTAEAL
jgi:hypothetical protein